MSEAIQIGLVALLFLGTTLLSFGNFRGFLVTFCANLIGLMFFLAIGMPIIALSYAGFLIISGNGIYQNLLKNKEAHSCPKCGSRPQYIKEQT